MKNVVSIHLVDAAGIKFGAAGAKDGTLNANSTRWIDLGVDATFFLANSIEGGIDPIDQLIALIKAAEDALVSLSLTKGQVGHLLYKADSRLTIAEYRKSDES